ncbi:ABC transporter ATP-binding protein, partial [Candidatus Omnitrophota bacterium]
VGIIGANGSGKTTILRLLAGVTAKTTGSVNVAGSVAPLIQVGAGFHPELTGRENIYLNGIILGLSKRQVDERFDTIVQFAELERFIDTPVKRYSSGMYVRLGFSIAIHVDASILLIDEILSVGDLSFQRKCLDMMSSIRKTDKSVVFVSHNLSAVRGLCDRAIWLNKGVIERSGDPEDVIGAYTQYMERRSEFTRDCNFVGQKTRWGTGEIRFNKIDILNTREEPTEVFAIGEQMSVHIEMEVFRDVGTPVFWLGIANNDGVWVTGAVCETKIDFKDSFTRRGKRELLCTFDSLFIQPGQYFLVIGVYDEFGNIAYDRIGRAGMFRISEIGEKYWGYDWHGLVPIASKWELKQAVAKK